MANNQGLLYDTYMDYYKRAMAAKDAGENDKARKFFLLAAETLRDLAQVSEGEMKKARYRTVKKLIEAAESLSQNTKAVRNGESDSNKTQIRSIDDTSEEYDLIFSQPNNKITLNDIIGLDEAKIAIHSLLIEPLKNPEAYAAYGLQAGGNILLEGPPGNGKTTFAQAVACEVGLPFVEVNSTSLVDPLIGNTAKNIKKTFSEIRRYVHQHHTAVIAFFDEFEEIARARGGDSKTSEESVPELLRQLQGFNTDNKNIVIIAATNLKNLIDPGILDRFGDCINIPMPTKNDRKQLFALKLRGLQELNELDLDVLAEVSDGLSGRGITNSCLDFKRKILAPRKAGQLVLEDPLTDIFVDRIKKMKAGKL